MSKLNAMDLIAAIQAALDQRRRPREAAEHMVDSALEELGALDFWENLAGPRRRKAGTDEARERKVEELAAPVASALDALGICEGTKAHEFAVREIRARWSSRQDLVELVAHGLAVAPKAQTVAQRWGLKRPNR